MNKVIFTDLDDTLANFISGATLNGNFDVARMYEPGFFLSLKPIEGSQVAVRRLIRMGFDVQILSQPVAESAHSYSEKVQWIGMYFPDLINKINLTQDKGLFRGDFLIDDNAPKWKDKFEANGGKFLHFNYQANHRVEWHRIVKYLESKK